MSRDDPSSGADAKETVEYINSASHLNAHGLPRIPVDLSANKLPIFLNWLPTVFTSGVLPIVGYFALRYGTDQKLSIVLSPWLAAMGAVSLFTLCRRSWALYKSNSTCRPLGQQARWGLDFFNWNFIFGFIALTALISAGISVPDLTVVTLPLTVLMLYVCGEILLIPILMALNVKAFIRFSSIAKGERLRSGVYVIIEDVVAVDGKQGQAFRQAWSDRYEASPVFRAHLRHMDILWGGSGLCIVALIWGLAFGLGGSRTGKEIAYALGESREGAYARLSTG